MRYNKIKIYIIKWWNQIIYNIVKLTYTLRKISWTYTYTFTYAYTYRDTYAYVNFYT